MRLDPLALALDAGLDDPARADIAFLEPVVEELIALARELAVDDLGRVVRLLHLPSTESGSNSTTRHRHEHAKDRDLHLVDDFGNVAGDDLERPSSSSP
jgi:hypothetical protein